MARRRKKPSMLAQLLVKSGFIAFLQDIEVLPESPSNRKPDHFDRVLEETDSWFGDMIKRVYPNGLNDTDHLEYNWAEFIVWVAGWISSIAIALVMVFGGYSLMISFNRTDFRQYQRVPAPQEQAQVQAQPGGQIIPGQPAPVVAAPAVASQNSNVIPASPDCPSEPCIFGGPDMTDEQVARVLSISMPEVQATAPLWNQLSKKYGVKTSYALAWFHNESNLATHPDWAGWKGAPGGDSTKNPGNIICIDTSEPHFGTFSTCGYYDYPTWGEGVEGLYQLLNYYQRVRKLNTLQAIVQTWVGCTDCSGSLNVIITTSERYRKS